MIVVRVPLPINNALNQCIDNGRIEKSQTFRRVEGVWLFLSLISTFIFSSLFSRYLFCYYLEKLFKHQDISSLMIVSFITHKFDQAVFFWREIWCWSALGLQGLILVQHAPNLYVWQKKCNLWDFILRLTLDFDHKRSET